MIGRRGVAFCLVSLALSLPVSRADAVFSGVGPATNDHRFDAVCALSRRCHRPPEQPQYDCGDPDACASPCIADLGRDPWIPAGSGVLVRWTQPGASEPRIGILTARHFIDANGSAGQCVQAGL